MATIIYDSIKSTSCSTLPCTVFSIQTRGSALSNICCLSAALCTVLRVCGKDFNVCIHVCYDLCQKKYFKNCMYVI